VLHICNPIEMGGESRRIANSVPAQAKLGLGQTSKTLSQKQNENERTGSTAQAFAEHACIPRFNHQYHTNK
jgi:hypothetical protein